MSNHVIEAADQLRWWLRLPPTNLIDRGDHVRFRHALYLMIHQIATVLYGINGLPEIMYFPSRLAGARERLNGLPKAPVNAGTSLWTMATEREPNKAWETAAGLMRETLVLLDEGSEATGFTDSSAASLEIEEGVFKPERSNSPDELFAIATAAAEKIRHFAGVESVALGGSLARGVADDQSDIDLLAFGLGIPDETARRRMISAWPDVQFGPLIEQACDSVLVDGVMVHVRYWTTGTVDDMLASFPSPPAQRILAEELQCCHGLIDPNGRIGEWKRALDEFPSELVAGVIEQARLRLPVFRSLWQKAGTADDRIHLYCLANQAVNDYLVALYIRNGRFLSTPRCTHRDIPSFEVVPSELETGMSQLTDGVENMDEAAARWRVLEGLWEELVGMRSKLP